LPSLFTGPTLYNKASVLAGLLHHHHPHATRSDQPKPPAVAIVRQNGLSSASCRASVAVMGCLHGQANIEQLARRSNFYGN